MTRAEVLARLRAREPEIRQLGIARLAIFGSTARDEQQESSDIDLAVQLDAASNYGLMRLVQIEDTLRSMLGAPVDLVTEPVDQPRLQAKIDRDRVHVF